jgi:hypothetical protein
VLSQGSEESHGAFREVATAAYKLDKPGAPKNVEFRAIKPGGVFAPGITTMEIARYDDKTFIGVRPGSEPMVWVRVDTQRYFVVFAARQGNLQVHQEAGPALAMLIKAEGGRAQVETFGLYFDKGEAVTGPVPPEIYRGLIEDSGTASGVVLRLEVAEREFEASLKILHTWQRRAREGALLFQPNSYLNTIAPLKEIAESLNQCGEKIKLHKLDWSADDEIGAKYPASQVAFQYIKKLRLLNETLHIRSERFQEMIGSR